MIPVHSWDLPQFYLSTQFYLFTPSEPGAVTPPHTHTPSLRVCEALPAFLGLLSRFIHLHQTQANLKVAENAL